MPLYTYNCPNCHTFSDVMIKLADLPFAVVTCQCSGQMVKQVTAARVAGDYPAYDCPITGKLIEGRRAHEENLARHSCRLLEPGELDERKRRDRDDEERFDKKIEATTEQFIHELPITKREALHEDFARGASVSFTRQAN